MTHQNAHPDRSNAPGGDELDALLRRWHEQNRTAAAATRDQLLARLSAERHPQQPTPDQQQHRLRDHRAVLVKLILWRFIMHRYTRVAASLLLVVTVIALLFPPVTQQTMASDGYIMLPDGGRLDAFGEDGSHIGPCPLAHTNVDVHIAGHFSRTTVRQQYKNPYPHKVEAIYTFPLGHHGAVDRMTMTVGNRVIVGEVQERQRARETYQAARDQGYVASLLEQERPNIFTQSVANIEPGEEITIEISYVEILEAVDGQYSFVFPMVVAPRYIPGSPLGVKSAEDGSFSPDTDQVDDASRITPMPEKPDVRAGHDIAVRVRIETGGPGIEWITSKQHEIVRYNEHRSVASGELTAVSVALRSEDEIPNRDFVLSWKPSGDGIEEAFFTHTGDSEQYGPYAGGFFTMILQPPHRVPDELARPRELVFVLDNSGSMSSASLSPSGYSAIDAAKEVISKAIDTMRPDDRFNIISFNNAVSTLWDSPRANTAENRAEAQRFIEGHHGGGGTEMANAVYAALGAHGSASPGIRSLMSPRDLANLPADGREVIIKAAAADWCIDPVATGVRHALKVNDNLAIELDFQGRTDFFATRATPTMRLGGTWQTRDGRRVLVVESLEWIGSEQDEQKPLRIVLFATDGMVGNDDAIVQAVRDHARETRMFTIGMSSSPNRSLLDAMAEAGRGASDYVLPGDDPAAIVQRFVDRIATPVLTDISLEFDGVEVIDVLPGLDRLRDLFDFSPLVIHGRYTTPGFGTLTIRGRTGAGPYQRIVNVNLPAQQPDHDVIATLWARQSIDRLQEANRKDDIVALGEQFQIMSEFTSFVAVEMQRKTIDGKSTLVRVPIEFPEDMSWEGTFGRRGTLGDSVSRPDDWPKMQLRRQQASGPQSLPRRGQAPSAPSDPPAGAAPMRDRAVGERASGGSGGGGGALFGEPEEWYAEPEVEHRETVRAIIQDTVAPNAWDDLGGDLLTLRELNGLWQVIPLVNTPEANEKAAAARAFINRFEPIFSGRATDTGQFKGAGFTESPRDIAALKLLHEQLVEIGFDSVPLEQAVERLVQQTGTDVSVHWPSLERVGWGRELEITVPAEQRSLAQTLKAMFAPLDELDFVQVHVRDGVIRVTSDEHHREHVVTEVYDIADLLKAAADQSTGRWEAVGNVVSIIVDQVDSTGWRSLGGDTGSVRDLDNWLFITNTVENHRAIQHLLSQIRRSLGLSVTSSVYEPAIDQSVQIMIYDVRPLIEQAQQRAHGQLSSIESLDVLFNVVQDLVDPPSWRNLGGDVGTAQELVGLMIIGTTPDRQEQVGRLLKQIEAALALNPGGQSKAETYSHADRAVIMYDVRHLVDAFHFNHTTDSIIKRVMQAVDSSSWRRSGGDTGTLLVFGKMLIIEQTAENHRAIARALQQLQKEPPR